MPKLHERKKRGDKSPTVKEVCRKYGSKPIHLNETKELRRIFLLTKLLLQSGEAARHLYDVGQLVSYWCFLTIPPLHPAVHMVVLPMCLRNQTYGSISRSNHHLSMKNRKQ